MTDEFSKSLRVESKWFLVSSTAFGLPIIIGFLDFWEPGLGIVGAASASLLSFALLDVLSLRNKATPPPVLWTAAKIILLNFAILVPCAFIFWLCVRLLVIFMGGVNGIFLLVVILSAAISFGLIAAISAWRILSPQFPLSRLMISRIATVLGIAVLVIFETAITKAPTGLAGAISVLIYMGVSLLKPSPVPVACLFLLVLTCCTSSISDAPPGPHDWRQGWVDGCNYAHRMHGWATKWEIDITRRNSNTLYGQGIKAGIKDCE